MAPSIAFFQDPAVRCRFYAFVASILMLQAAACGGDMCGLSGILPAMLLLPLSLLSFLAAFVSTALANAIRLLALVATPIGSERLENVLSRAAGHAEFRLTPNRVTVACRN